jgi:hypothetical protein
MRAGLLRRALPIIVVSALLVACSGSESPGSATPDASGGADSTVVVVDSGGQDGKGGSNTFAEAGDGAISNPDRQESSPTPLDATDGPPDTGAPDVAPDIGAPDVAADAGPPDVAPDIGAPDVAADAGAPDVAADAASTDANDGGGGDGAPIGILLRGTIGALTPLPSAVATVRLVKQGLNVPGAMSCNGTMCLRSGGVFP